MPTTPIPPRPRRRALAVATSIVAAVVAVTADDAGATRRTESAAIAAEAGRAVTALERWRDSRRPADYVRYVQSRDEAARLTGTDLGLDVESVQAAWAATPVPKQHVLLAAVSQLGVPYRYAASEPGVGFDCSGLTSYAFGRAGASLPRVSGDQISAAERTDGDAAEAGDLVYWPGHVGIYLGGDTYVHSPNSGNVVEVALLPERSLTFGDAVGDALVDGDDPVPADESSAEASLVDRAAPVAE